MIRYYEWGNEKQGCVKIWIKTKKGEVKNLGEIKREELPEGAIFENPYC